MKKLTRLRLFVVIAAVLSSIGSGHAYVLKQYPPASRLPMAINLGTDQVPFFNGGGTFAWDDAPGKATYLWNQAGIGPGLDHKFFSVTASAPHLDDGCNVDGSNDVIWATGICGTAFGDALAVTRTWTAGGRVVEANIFVNSNAQWTGYDGPIQFVNGNEITDIFRVVLHEMGHAAGLDHPDSAGQVVDSIMNSRESDIYTIQPDDIAGAHAIAWGRTMGCTYSISPIVRPVGAGNDAGSVSISNVQGDCGWTAVSNAGWLTITSASSGRGDGTVSYSVAANLTNSLRFGTITIAGQTFWVNQEGTPTGHVVEFYNTNLDNYFITADANEAAAIDNGSAGPGWSRTGNAFKSGGSVAVCRFYGSVSPGPNSHFYTADAAECAQLKQLQASTPATQMRWNFESLDFLTTVPTNGTCPSGTTPVYRAYNNGFARGVDSNHRITSSQTAIQQVVSRGWKDEGVVMCAPN